MVDASPMMHSVTCEGNRVIVTFSTPGEGLKTRDNKPSDTWEIAGADGKFVPATAEISGAKVIVSTPGVTVPVSVRLGWKSDSNCNLVNSAGLPSMPFLAVVPNETK
jgi:sialate O-acetylesterase